MVVYIFSVVVLTGLKRSDKEKQVVCGVVTERCLDPFLLCQFFDVLRCQRFEEEFDKPALLRLANQRRV